MVKLFIAKAFCYSIELCFLCLFQHVYVDICLQNVDQYYRRKCLIVQNVKDAKMKRTGKLKLKTKRYFLIKVISHLSSMREQLRGVVFFGSLTMKTNWVSTEVYHHDKNSKTFGIYLSL